MTPPTDKPMTTQTNDVKFYGHIGCTKILPLSKEGPRGATHSCWCSFWKMTDRGLKILRGGHWQNPTKREVSEGGGEVLTNGDCYD